jgi:Uncharacterized protein conserved in bacteria C-term(DUF2220)
MNPEARLFESLQSVANGAARIGLDDIHRALSAAFPQLDGSPSRRAKLREMLDELAGSQVLRLPADRRRGWQNQPAPALPFRVTLVRQESEKAARLDHRRFPWVREMGFIVELPLLHTPGDALRLHEFFKNGGGRSPIVPTKERSWQIFGEEKRLDDLQRGELFGEGRLTLEMLRCQNVTQILAFARGLNAVDAPVLIVENECTFHSFCRLNHQLGIYSGVVFGHGDTVLKAAGFLRDLAGAIAVEVFHYFGDLDPRGLRIGRDLSVMMRTLNLIVVPADRLYTELLLTPPAAARKPLTADEQSIAWLSPELRNAVRERLSNFGRIAQEALGWEKLCAIHGADPNSDFNLGFAPPAN